MARRLGAGLLVIFAASALGGAEAQPDPSFRAACGTLREHLVRLGASPGAYFVVQVVGRLEFVAKSDSVALLGMWGPPNPRVLCLTYTVDGWKVGDAAMISGTFSENRPDYIKLDPCLHAKAPEVTP